MRRLSPRFFRSIVTLTTYVVTRDAPGGNIRTPSAGTIYGPGNASVQTASASRREAFAGLYAETTHTVLWRTYPVDTSAGARASSASASSPQRLGPEVNVQDLLTWAAPAGPPVKLVALGPALDQGGSGAGWVVYCKAMI
jgi:hypothetical protein